MTYEDFAKKAIPNWSVLSIELGYGPKVLKGIIGIVPPHPYRRLDAPEIVDLLRGFPKDYRLIQILVTKGDIDGGLELSETYFVDAKGRFWKDSDLPKDPIRREIFMVGFMEWERDRTLL